MRYPLLIYFFIYLWKSLGPSLLVPLLYCNDMIFGYISLALQRPSERTLTCLTLTGDQVLGAKTKAPM